jgi:hypothetical protein
MFGHFGKKTRARIRRLHAFARAEMVKDYQAARRAHTAARKQLGLDAALDAEHRAFEVHTAALRRLCRVKPRSHAGLAALIERLAANVDCYAFKPFAGRSKSGIDLFGTLARAATSPALVAPPAGAGTKSRQSRRGSHGKG